MCGSTEDLCALDVAAGGVQCRVHRHGTGTAPATIAVVQHILDCKVAGVLARTDLRAETVAEVTAYARTATEHHLERRIRASSLFETPRTG